MGRPVFALRRHPPPLGFYLLTLCAVLSSWFPQLRADPPSRAAPAPTEPPAAAVPTRPADAPTAHEASVPPPVTGYAATSPQGLTIYARERRSTSIPTLPRQEVTVGPCPPIPLELITRVFRHSSYAALHACYLRALILAPALTGTIRTQFLVGKEGTVISAQVMQGLTPELDACVQAQIAQSTFPRPHNGVPVTVRYPFNFLLKN